VRPNWNELEFYLASLVGFLFYCENSTSDYSLSEEKLFEKNFTPSCLKADACIGGALL
jgi:hypothetical protein